MDKMTILVLLVIMMFVWAVTNLLIQVTQEIIYEIVSYRRMKKILKRRGKRCRN